MTGRLKRWALAAVSFVGLALAYLFQSKRLRANREALERERRMNEIEERAGEALAEGVSKEELIREEQAADSRRDYFER